MRRFGSSAGTRSLQIEGIDLTLPIRVWNWVKGFPKRHMFITVLLALYVLFNHAYRLSRGIAQEQ